jgi:hypothetical protein
MWMSQGKKTRLASRLKRYLVRISFVTRTTPTETSAHPSICRNTASHRPRPLPRDLRNKKKNCYQLKHVRSRRYITNTVEAESLHNQRSNQTGSGICVNRCDEKGTDWIFVFETKKQAILLFCWVENGINSYVRLSHVGKHMGQYLKISFSLIFWKIYFMCILLFWFMFVIFVLYYFDY